MKYNTIIKLLLIALALQLSGCKKENIKEIKKEAVHASTASDTIFDKNNPYYLFIQKNNPEALKDNKLIYFKEENIDLDGKKEAIVALGELGEKEGELSTINTTFLLRNNNGVIKKIEDFEGFGYNAYRVKLISLQGKKQKYIYFGLTNYVSMMGFSLYELSNNKLKEIVTSASPSGRGDDYLTDKNNDGKYDGYSQFRTSTDALYYDVTMLYVYKNDVFKLSETHVDISPEYPDTIEEILLEYMSLRSLDFGESKEVNQRLKLICKDPNASTIKWNNAWHTACFNTRLDLDNSIEFNTKEDTYTTTATYSDEDQKQYQCEFELEKYNNQWQITKVTVTKNGEK